MRNLVVKLHIYAGLLTFAQLVIYGTAGLVATVYPAGQRTAAASAVRYVPFTTAASATDKQVADEVYRALNMQLARPIPAWAIRHTPENELLLDFYNVNGIRRVTVLEREHRLRVEELHNSTAIFLDEIHTITTGDREAPRLVHIWAVYNVFAMWCLLAFCVSGAYLWLSSQARSWWAWTCLAAGTSLFVALWVAFR